MGKEHCGKSNFSFSHSVFKSLVLQTCKIQGLFGKGLKECAQDVHRKMSLISVVLDNRGNSKGYGFVRFSEETDQQKALIEMQHTTGVGRKTIRVSLATPKK